MKRRHYPAEAQLPLVRHRDAPPPRSDLSVYVPGRDKELSPDDALRTARGTAIRHMFTTQATLRRVGFPVRHHLTKALRHPRDTL